MASFARQKFSSAFEFMTNQMYIIFTSQRFMVADLVKYIYGWTLTLCKTMLPLI